MGWKSVVIKPIANIVSRQIDRWSGDAVNRQQLIFRDILQKASGTDFGAEHHFEDIRSHKDFTEAVPVTEYEQIKPYIERIAEGRANVLWPGKPRYFAKTSGTTSGVKYIPITSDSIPNHMNTARNALFRYVAKTRNASIFDGKMIFLSGSPELETYGGIPTGRLSGIVNHLVPAWVKGNQLPDYETNCIEDWEVKLDRIIKQTVTRDMRLISGIPPWVQMYYEGLLEATGKQSVKEIFPDYKLFVYGGVNYSPYKAKLESLSGPGVDGLETYPASEGFIAFQDRWDETEGMLLNADSGIFFEFIPLNKMHDERPERLTLAEVKAGVDYVIILSSNAGLWAYNLGDTVAFTSVDPPRLKVTGRVRHFISAFGEHVIAKEVELAMEEVSSETGVEVIEFTVAPQVAPPEGGLPYHEWFVAFAKGPSDPGRFAELLDASMVRQNIYYRDLIEGKILRPLQLRILKPEAFREYMKSIGKLGGQNKVPRLANNREIADALAPFIQKTVNG
jgi:hypothetical protein